MALDDAWSTRRKTAVRALDAARAETLPRFSADARILAGSVTDKGAGAFFDPVTEADRKAEDVMRGIILDAHPEDQVLGEEGGITGKAGGFLWSLDPVDGTRAFMAGVPVWTTLLGLSFGEGVAQLGLIDAPALDARYEGITVADPAALRRSGPATDAGGGQQRLGVSSKTQLSEAVLTTTEPFIMFPRGGEITADLAGLDRFMDVRERVRFARWGLDALGYALLAQGRIDLVVEQGLKAFDVAALIPVVEAAGGVISDGQGGQAGTKGRVIAAATRELHDQAANLLYG